MAIPVTIQQLLEKHVVEWARIEFKKGWNPKETLNTISAFANDIDNWGGGYIVIGIEEKDGQILRPIEGLKKNQIDHIQKEIVRYCNYLVPRYIPVVEPVVYEDKDLLLVWCPGGYDRPYKCPKDPDSKKNIEKIYYIRKLSLTMEATDSEVKELLSLSRDIPFDDRANMRAELSDLKLPLIWNYLTEVDSALLEEKENRSLEELANDLRIANGPKEYFKPLNVGLLFFNSNPEKFFEYARIEVVNIPDPTGQGMEERIFTGPIDQQLRSALAYIRNNVIAERVYKVPDQAEAIRVFNYAYAAIEEFVSNAVYHKSYQLYDPITIRIEKDNIEITSMPGPDRSISDEDIKNYTMKTKRYRNRRIGDFLKELQLIEGRNTGIPTALNAIKRNGSPLPIFKTDEERSYFSVILPIHEAFIDKADDEIKDVEIQPTKKQISVTRKTKQEIKNLIIKDLKNSDCSTRALYKNMGYSGSPSKTFKDCINELISDGQIGYVGNDKSDSNRTLTLSNRNTKKNKK